MRVGLFFGVICVASIVAAQTPSSDIRTPDTRTKKHTSAKHDVGSGAGDIGKGAAKGVGSAAKGTGKAAGDIVTLHPVDAAADLGKGAAGTAKNVGTGTVKGTGKIVKGTGKALKHIF